MSCAFIKYSTHFSAIEMECDKKHFFYREIHLLPKKVIIDNEKYCE